MIFSWTDPLRFEVERRESEARHTRSLEQLENRVASLDVQNRDLLEVSVSRLAVQNKYLLKVSVISLDVQNKYHRGECG